MQGHSQFSLLRQRRFGPFFLTQLAGAFNDSLLKQVLILLVTFHGAQYSSLSSGVVTNLAAGLFILPFVLFSAFAGQLADRYDKARVIRVVKIAEVAIMLVACAGFYFKSLPLLLACLFAMGCHSAFFGPVKYSLLPRVLGKDELTGGNGLLEMGTFLSILLGTLAAGVLVASTTEPFLLSAALLAVAVIGLLACLFIPATGVADPTLKPGFGMVADTIATVQLAHREGEGVWNSLLAISWFWFLGAVVLSQIPAIGRDLLQGDTSVVSLLLTVFSLGVAAGSLLCERLSGHKVEIGLVPVGSIGLCVFLADLALASLAYAQSAPVGPSDWRGFLAASGSLRVLVDVMLLGVSGGIFIVPLYAFVQLRSDPKRQSRIISANNILNALFMVVAAGMSAALLAGGLGVTGLLLVCVGLNMLVALYIYHTVPEFLWRFVSWIVVHGAYRLKIQGQEHIPEQGAAVLAPNHVSYVDALIISAISPRPIRFVMDAGIFRVPVLSWLFRQVRAIPIAPAREDPATLTQAMDAVREALQEGELVCIFPEGRLTPDGELGQFRPGIARILETTPVPVIPIGLHGLWESRFSRRPVPALLRLTRLRLWRQLTVRIGKAQASELSVGELRSLVLDLSKP